MSYSCGRGANKNRGLFSFGVYYEAIHILLISYKKQRRSIVASLLFTKLGRRQSGTRTTCFTFQVDRDTNMLIRLQYNTLCGMWHTFPALLCNVK